MTHKEALEQAASIIEHLSRKGYGMIAEGKAYPNKKTNMHYLVISDHLYEMVDTIELLVVKIGH